MRLLLLILVIVATACGPVTQQPEAEPAVLVINYFDEDVELVGEAGTLVMIHANRHRMIAPPPEKEYAIRGHNARNLGKVLIGDGLGKAERHGSLLIVPIGEVKPERLPPDLDIEREPPPPIFN
jgi:hypothetical protein